MKKILKKLVEKGLAYKRKNQYILQIWDEKFYIQPIGFFGFNAEIYHETNYGNKIEPISTVNVEEFLVFLIEELQELYRN